MCSSNDSKRVHSCLAQLRYACDHIIVAEDLLQNRSPSTSAEHSMHELLQY